MRRVGPSGSALHGDLQFTSRFHPGARRCAHGWLSAVAAPRSVRTPAPIASPRWTVIGRGQLGQQARAFTAIADASAIELRFGDEVGVRVALDGSRISRTHGAQRSALVGEAIWGAGLVLALALRGVFCLHASAVARGRRCFLIVGPSGRGKSTLAARIAALPGWQRLADDIAPVRASASGLQLLPHFPQLKLKPDPWPGADVPRSLPVRAICLLARGAMGEPEIATLGARDAALALVAGTVGARLFPPPLLATHLRTMAAHARSVPVCGLTVPDDRARLSHTAAAVARLMLAGLG